MTMFDKTKTYLTTRFGGEEYCKEVMFFVEKFYEYLCNETDLAIYVREDNNESDVESLFMFRYVEPMMDSVLFDGDMIGYLSGENTKNFEYYNTLIDKVLYPIWTHELCSKFIDEHKNGGVK